jgi:three-Cys-motif partner protein
MDPEVYQDREQTAVKHKILQRYLSGLVPIVGAWADDIAYVDCLAGPWKSADPKYLDTSFSTAVETLRASRKVLEARGKNPSMRCLFIENDPDAFAKLKNYCEGISDIETTAHNWDLMTHVTDVAAFARKRQKSFPFIFIDPKGWEALDLRLLTPILSLERGEVLITLMTSWISRFLTDPTKHFDRLFGVDFERLTSLEGDRREEGIVQSFRRAIRNAGHFQYVCSLPVMKSSQDAFHFHMIYCTRHIRGVEVFKATEKTAIPFMHEARAKAQVRRRFENTGQNSLFDATAQYREKKFTRYAESNLGIAKDELRTLLEEKGEIRYDDVRATVLQHSTVTETHLREWLEDWKKQGWLTLIGISGRQGTPQKGRQHLLRWQRPQNE